METEKKDFLSIRGKTFDLIHLSAAVQRIKHVPGFYENVMKHVWSPAREDFH